MLEDRRRADGDKVLFLLMLLAVAVVAGCLYLYGQGVHDKKVRGARQDECAKIAVTPSEKQACQ